MYCITCIISLQIQLSHYPNHFASLLIVQALSTSDTNWPQGLLNIFNISRNQNTSLDSRYYGPYDRLFNYAVIEGSFTFFFTPQIAPDETSARDAVDFVVFMVVLNQEQKPVLFVEIKDDGWADKSNRRQRADTLMRHRYDQMLFDCLPFVFTSIVEIRSGEITPDFVGRPHANRILPLNFLEGQWNLDILSPDGSTKMQEIVAYVKAEADNVVGQWGGDLFQLIQ